MSRKRKDRLEYGFGVVGFCSSSLAFEAMDGFVLTIASFGTGLFVGLLFTGLKLPLPAPPALAGVLGILGIFAGGKLWPILAAALQR